MILSILKLLSLRKKLLPIKTIIVKDLRYTFKLIICQKEPFFIVLLKIVYIYIYINIYINIYIYIYIICVC